MQTLTKIPNSLLATGITTFPVVWFETRMSNGWPRVGPGAPSG